MRGKTLLILLVLVALVASGIYLVERPAEGGGDAASQRIGQPLFPDLAGRLNDVAALTLESSEGKLALERDGETWRVQDKDGYPADFDRVRRTLIGVSELTVLEAKTSRPEHHARLGVEDPLAPGAASALLTLQDGSGAQVAALVAGNPGPGRDTLYARRATEPLSWLVRGPLELPRSATGWIDTSLPPLPSERVRLATVVHADGDSVTVARASEDDAVWAVQDMGDGMQPSSPTVGRVLAAALESVDLEDVRSAAAAPLAGEQQALTTFTTFDGLVLTATSAVEDGRTWFRFAASQAEPAPVAPAPAPAAPDAAAPADEGAGADPGADADAEASADEGDDPGAEAAEAAARREQVAREVAELNARLEPWVFQLPEYRAGTLRKRKADLIQPVAAPDPAPPAEAPEDHAAHEGAHEELPDGGAPPDASADGARPEDTAPPMPGEEPKPAPPGPDSGLPAPPGDPGPLPDPAGPADPATPPETPPGTPPGGDPPR